MQVPELMLINKSMIMRGICADDVEWHTSDEDHELEASACAVGPPAVVPTWKIKVHPHLKCMHQRVAVFKKHVTFCRVSRVPEATFLLLALTRLDGVAQPFIDRQPAKSRGKGKEGKKKDKLLCTKVEIYPNLGTPGVLPKTPTSRSESRPPMSKKRPTETGATRGGPHHAPRLRPDQCLLCRKIRHRASECHNKKDSDIIFTWQTCIWYLRSGLCCVQCHGFRC